LVPPGAELPEPPEGAADLLPPEAPAPPGDELELPEEVPDLEPLLKEPEPELELEGFEAPLEEPEAFGALADDPLTGVLPEPEVLVDELLEELSAELDDSAVAESSVGGGTASIKLPWEEGLMTIWQRETRLRFGSFI